MSENTSPEQEPEAPSTPDGEVSDQELESASGGSLALLLLEVHPYMLQLPPENG